MIRICRLTVLSLLVALSGAAFAVPDPERVNINTADAQTLASMLKGVGLSKAEAIVKYREEHGDFIDIYELANVKGIGERTVEINESKLSLKE